MVEEPQSKVRRTDQQTVVDGRRQTIQQIGLLDKLCEGHRIQAAEIVKGFISPEKVDGFIERWRPIKLRHHLSTDTLVATDLELELVRNSAKFKQKLQSVWPNQIPCFDLSKAQVAKLANLSADDASWDTAIRLADSNLVLKHVAANLSMNKPMLIGQLIDYLQLLGHLQTQKLVPKVYGLVFIPDADSNDNKAQAVRAANDSKATGSAKNYWVATELVKGQHTGKETNLLTYQESPEFPGANLFRDLVDAMLKALGESQVLFFNWTPEGTIYSNDSHQFLLRDVAPEFCMQIDFDASPYKNNTEVVKLANLLSVVANGLTRLAPSYFLVLWDKLRVHVEKMLESPNLVLSEALTIVGEWWYDDLCQSKAGIRGYDGFLFRAARYLSVPPLAGGDVSYFSTGQPKARFLYESAFIDKHPSNPDMFRFRKSDEIEELVRAYPSFRAHDVRCFIKCLLLLVRARATSYLSLSRTHPTQDDEVIDITIERQFLALQKKIEKGQSVVEQLQKKYDSLGTQKEEAQSPKAMLEGMEKDVLKAQKKRLSKKNPHNTTEARELKRTEALDLARINWEAKWKQWWKETKELATVQKIFWTNWDTLLRTLQGIMTDSMRAKEFRLKLELKHFRTPYLQWFDTNVNKLPDSYAVPIIREKLRTAQMELVEALGRLQELLPSQTLETMASWDVGLARRSEQQTQRQPRRSEPTSALHTLADIATRSKRKD